MPDTTKPVATVDPDLDTLVVTRLALHMLAEHVLSPALHQATGRIGLRRTPGGFGTPEFETNAGPRRIRVEGGELVVEDATPRREPITTLRAAAAFVGIDAGAPAGVYTPSTPLELDRDLHLDARAAGRIADVFAATDEALAGLLDEHADATGGAVVPQLWPEHFDLAISLDEVNLGGSPGDGLHPVPYVYVGPWNPPQTDAGFWNEPFGASRPVGPTTSATDIVSFFHEGLQRASRLGG